MKVNKLIKIIGAVLIIVIITMGVFAYLLRSLISSDAIKQYLLPVAEEYIGRKINVEDIKISIFSGITVKGVSVAEKAGEKNSAGGEKFITFGTVDIRYNLWKLLKRELVLQSIYFSQPKINIIRNSDGTYNFSDIIERIDKKGESDKSTKGKGKGPEGEKNKNINFSINKIIFKGGFVRFIDKKTKPDGSLKSELADINLTLRGKSFSEPVDVLMQGMLEDVKGGGKGIPIALKGNVDFKARGFHLDGELKGIKPASFSDYVGTSLTDFISVKDISADFPFTALADDYEKEIKISSAPKISGSSGTFTPSVTATLKDIKNTPRYLMDISVKNTSLPLLISFLSADSRKKLDGVEIKSGTIDGVFNVNGSSEEESKVSYNGDVKLRAVKGLISDYPGLPLDIEGSALINSKGITFIANPLKLAGSDFEIKGTSVSQDKGMQNIILDIKSPFLNIDNIIKGMAKNDVKRKDKGKQHNGNKGKSAGKKDSAGGKEPLNIEANLKASSVQYNNVKFNDLKSNMKYTGGRLLVDALQFRLNDGTVSGSADVDLSNDEPSYTGKADIEKGGVADIIKILSPDFKGSIEGTITGNAAVSGSGAKWEKIKDKLQGEGKIIFGNITVSNIKAIDKVADFLKLDELKKIQFKDGDVKFKIDDGEVKYDELKLTGDSIKVKSDGDVGFDKSLDCRIELKVSPALSSKILKNNDFVSLLQDDSGWVAVPLKLKGTTDSPNVGFSSKAVNKTIIEKGKNLLKEKLFKLFNKNSSSNFYSSSDSES
ncbi:MAG: AsmA-like C-terminal domain-containing protein [Candidatus Schekmanbacteria bacterium]|nr:AsmA-like C-terminal domain-containing protein [Candidatus Schekmanbacteria bacterium]